MPAHHKPGAGVEHVRRAQANNAAGMKQVTLALDQMGVAHVPSQANFILVDVAPRAGRDVFQSLLAAGVIVRPMGGYRLPHHLRVTIGTPAENARFIDAMRAILKHESAS